MQAFFVAFLMWIAAGAFLICSGSANAQSSGSDATIVIVGGTLIDGTGRDPLQDSILVVEGSKIRAVGPAGTVVYPPSARILQAAGQFILPGLFDAHVHYRDWVGELFLAHGVTSVIDMGNPIDWILAQRDGIAKGKIVGPRIFAAGEALNSRFPEVSPGASLPAMEIAKVRKEVQGLIAQGVDKISVTIRQDPRTYAAIVEEAHQAGIPVSAYTAYARQSIGEGMDALQHSYSLAIGTKKEGSNTLQIIREESQARNAPYYLKHTQDYFMEPRHDDLVQLLAQRGTYVIPSMIFEYKLFNDHRKAFEEENLRLLTNPNLRYVDFEDYYPQLTSHSHFGIPRLGGPGYFGTLDFAGDDFKKYQQSYRNLQSFLRKLIQAGGKILAGTDAPNMLLPGISLHQELQLLVDAGLTPMQAIVAATKWPATFLRKESQLGTLEPGKLADLLIVRADPLQDIRNTKQIVMVMKEGRVLDVRYHPDFSNPIPRPFSSETQRNPLPRVIEISPKAATEGDREATITVRGSEFIFESTVLFAGERVATTFVTDTELRATISAPLLTRAGTFSVTVWNPRPAGGISSDVKFIVKFK